ncbi:hypothetical protein BJF90_29090 [Pseudonocardia sp. CNS-004]|nr:hypothetical protein BJF90_29090 [Pseudonocardia sp. CNS-004]
MHQVAELHQQAGRQLGGHRDAAGAVGPGLLHEHPEQPIDQHRHAGRPVQHVVDERGGRGVAPQQVRGPGHHPGAVERLQHHRWPGGGERAAERGGAGRARPRPVCHDQVAAGHRGQHREPLQLVRREQVCVVEQ